MSMPAPDWYADPADARLQRWWTGQGWTEHTRPAAPSPFASAAPYDPSQPLGVAPVKLAVLDKQVRRMNGIGYAGAVMAILSLLLNPFGLLSILAIIFSAIGLSKANGLRALGHRVTGRGWCIAGLVIGIIGTLYAARLWF